MYDVLRARYPAADRKTDGHNNNNNNNIPDGIKRVVK